MKSDPRVDELTFAFQDGCVRAEVRAALYIVVGADGQVYANVNGPMALLQSGLAAVLERKGIGLVVADAPRAN